MGGLHGAFESAGLGDWIVDRVAARQARKETCGQAFIDDPQAITDEILEAMYEKIGGYVNRIITYGKAWVVSRIIVGLERKLTVDG